MTEPFDPQPTPGEPPNPGPVDTSSASEIETLRGLGLDALTADGPPSASGWSAVTARAAHRRTRRQWLSGVAAAMVLVLVMGAGVAIARQGQESVDITAGPDADSDRQFVLPPADAGEIWVRIQPMRAIIDSVAATGASGESGGAGIDDPYIYMIGYRDADGSPQQLDVRSRQGYWFNSAPNGSTMTAPRTRPDTGDPVADSGLPATWPRISIAAPFEPAAITCSAKVDQTVYAANPDSLTAEIVLSAAVPTGPAVVVGTVGDNWDLSLSEWPPPLTDIPCELGPTIEASLTTAAQSLRLVSEPEWRQFVEEYGNAPNPYDNLQSSEATMVAPPESIPPSVAIPGEDDARVAIEAAVAQFSLQAPDGSYPNLEGGTDGATYQPMFDAVRMAPKVERGPFFNATSVWFVSEDEAVVRFTASPTLASGNVTVELSGRAVKIDGRWVVSRDTITSMLGRASLAPPTPN